MTKVALVHDWLTGMRGGEKCLQAFLKIYPQADIFTLLHVPGVTTQEIDRAVKSSSFIRHIPAAKKVYRHLLPLYPAAANSLDLSGYDFVISLSHAAAKNVKVQRSAKHISYCFTPMRYIWDQVHTYFGKLTPLLWPLIKSLRHWDIKSTQSVDHMVAISNFVAARIRCYYGRRSTVIYPPVDTSWITPITNYHKGEAFLYAGALVPYKRVELLLRAFNELGLELWIAGSGPDEARLRKLAKSNIKFFTNVEDAHLAQLYANCRALLFPAVEDFGMIPVECLAAGRPVIGLFAGALKESINAIKPWNNYDLAEKDYSGVFIKPELSDALVGSIIESVRFFIRHEGEFNPEACVKRAALYSPVRFYGSWSNFVMKNNLFLNKSENFGGNLDLSLQKYA